MFFASQVGLLVLEFTNTIICVQAWIHGLQAGLRCVSLNALPCLQVPAQVILLRFLNPLPSEGGTCRGSDWEQNSLFSARNLVDVTHTEDEAKALAEEDQVGSSEYISYILSNEKALKILCHRLLLTFSVLGRSS